MRKTYDNRADDPEYLRWANLNKEAIIAELKTRITELEAEVAHYKEWLKERTAELEQNIKELSK